MASREDWDNADWPKLWRYNLHYFDDLNAANASERLEEQIALVNRWIDQNPVAVGTGWEPFPVSLRVTNWIKWGIREGRVTAAVCDSLAVQVRWLARNLEFHLRGNHLLANAKALVFAGLYFSGPEADRWLEQGARLVVQQLPEQILADGGHFERSPMYHSLVLEDLLDLLNLLDAYRFPWGDHVGKLERALRESATPMLGWLSGMVHPDGEIAMFNDAAIDVGPSYESLVAYGFSLGVRAVDHRTSPCALLKASGYARFAVGAWTAIVDVGEVGPDFLPGHAHADTLSFELSRNGIRVITNSGTSTYDNGAVRSFERSTAAHNSVTVDGMNSSEVWHSFRVGRRARPIEVSCVTEGDALGIVCGHDGFAWLAGRPIHRRTLLLEGSSARWTDVILGRGTHCIEGWIPFVPGVVLTPLGESTWKVELPDSIPLRLSIWPDTVDCTIVQGTYSPRFGVPERRPVLHWRRQVELPTEVRVLLSTG